MPRVFNQKIKILYLMRVFLERTDEEHPMSVKELIIYLNSLGISAERKTVYDDIETLRNFGMDILNRREQPAGFYVASRRVLQVSMRPDSCGARFLYRIGCEP